jgi:hypothetical protein
MTTTNNYDPYFDDEDVSLTCLIKEISRFKNLSGREWR